MGLILWWELQSTCKGEKVKGWKREKIREWKMEKVKGWKGEKIKVWKSERKEKMTAPADERAGMVQSGITRMTSETR